MLQDRGQHGGAEAHAALAAPAGDAVWQVGVVLEGHLERERDAAEAVGHPLRGQGQQFVLEAPDRIAVFGLEIRAGGGEASAKRAWRARCSSKPGTSSAVEKNT